MKKPTLFLPAFSLWIAMAIAPLPLLYLAIHFLFQWQYLNQVEAEIDRIKLKSMHMKTAQMNEGVLQRTLRMADPHYLDKHVETLTFLLPEIKKLESIHSDNPGDEMISKRLHFLKGGNNRLLFSEEQIRTNEIFREVEEKQQSEIELNEEDLKKLLCLIEGITIWPYGPKEGKPQFIIKDFKLSKKELPSREKVYVVSMELIKRENLERR